MSAYGEQSTAMARGSVLASTGMNGMARDSRIPGGATQPRIVSIEGKGRIVSDTGTYGSKYSSGVVSDLGDWGDPGPDVGSVRSDASQLGSGSEMGWDRMRETDNASPVSVESKISVASSKGGVGKAM